MALKIGERLIIYGWTHETEDFFFEVAIFWWQKLEPRYGTVEEFLYNPDDCIVFCNKIRAITGVDIKNHELLRCLMNLRKGKYLDRVKKHALKAIRENLDA